MTYENILTKMASTNKQVIYSKLVSSCNTTVKGFNKLSKFGITQDSLSFGKFQFNSDKY